MQGAVESIEPAARKRSLDVRRAPPAQVIRLVDTKPKRRETPEIGEELFEAGRVAAFNRLKRLVDLLIAVPVLIFVSPLMLALAIAIRLQDGGPALYRQPRIGLGGKEFTCFKFRTMVQGADTLLLSVLARDPAAAEEWRRDQKLRRDPRVLGAVGRFLRVTSLDELPQLLNIVRGEMSLVGPRPIVRSEVTKYHSYFRYYKAVRPGVTGLWQVSGRNNVSYAKRVRLDAAYARKSCLKLDAWILLQTIPAVLFRRGAY